MSAASKPPPFQSAAVRDSTSQASLALSRNLSCPAGGIQAARQRIQVGFSRAGKTVRTETGDTNPADHRPARELITAVPRIGDGEISRLKACGTRQRY